MRGSGERINVTHNVRPPGKEHYNNYNLYLYISQKSYTQLKYTLPKKRKTIESINTE